MCALMSLEQQGVVFYTCKDVQVFTLARCEGAQVMYHASIQEHSRFITLLPQPHSLGSPGLGTTSVMDQRQT